jgi:hypothetical protein
MKDCNFDGCSWGAGHDGPHNRQCPKCEGSGKRLIEKKHKVSCKRCGGHGRIDVGRKAEWYLNPGVGFWFAEVNGGWRVRGGVTLYAWPAEAPLETERRNPLQALAGADAWQWLVRRHNEEGWVGGRHEKYGRSIHRWGAFSYAEKVGLSGLAQVDVSSDNREDAPC